IAGGITLPDSQNVKRALKSLSFAIHFTDEKAAFLGYCLDDVDRAAIVDEILYQSTVTNRGIDEAVRRFAYEWRDKPLSTWSIPTSHGKRGKLAAEWNAAFRSGLTWAQFCGMPGSEQSAVVAFWALEDKLVYLLTQSK
ncbi:MAG: hypothetical protein KKC37_16940, partial [Proteobacteria bacterium]|nr:hypothetical protein [Pseudomonadota bacterium]